MKEIRIILLSFVMFNIIFSCTQQSSKIENKNNKDDTQKDGINRIINMADGEKIYIKSKVWGISNNHQEIIFSENPITIPSKENDYIFYTDEVFYKINNKILTIYAPFSGKNIPKKSFKNIKVVFKGLKHFDEISDYSKNYKKYGLEKVSVYDN